MGAQALPPEEVLIPRADRGMLHSDVCPLRARISRRRHARSRRVFGAALRAARCAAAIAAGHDDHDDQYDCHGRKLHHRRRGMCGEHRLLFDELRCRLVPIECAVLSYSRSIVPAGCESVLPESCVHEPVRRRFLVHLYRNADLLPRSRVLRRECRLLRRIMRCRRMSDVVPGPGSRSHSAVVPSKLFRPFGASASVRLRRDTVVVAVVHVRSPRRHRLRSSSGLRDRRWFLERGGNDRRVVVRGIGRCRYVA